jgi:hypothetical protein
MVQPDGRLSDMDDGGIVDFREVVQKALRAQGARAKAGDVVAKDEARPDTKSYGFESYPLRTLPLVSKRAR